MWYRIFRVVVNFLAFVLCRTRVVAGANYLREVVKGRAIIIANHIHWNDPMVVAACIKRKIYIMAKEELFRNRIVAWAIGEFNVFPVKRGKADIGAIKKALKVLREDTPLLIFPEGTRSRDGELLPFFDGPASLALKTDAPVLPIYIAPYHIGGKVRLYVGEPIELAAALPETLKGAQRIEAANKLLETSVQTLKDRAEL